MNKQKRIVSIIPARGGSKGIPRKNILLVNRKPLIAYSIEASRGSKYIQETYVSTDDEEIAQISTKYNADVVNRPKKFATDTASSESVLLHFAKVVDFDILVFLQCTSPLTLSKDIDGATELLLSGKYDSVLSVTENSGGFLCGGFLWNEKGESLNYDFRNRKRRQEIGTTYRENGAIYVMSKDGLLKNKNRLFGNIGMYVMPRLRSFEIDEIEDIKFLGHWMRRMKGVKLY